MNKRANRRAFFVCAAICVMYISIVTKLPERFGTARIAEHPGTTAQALSLAMHEEVPDSSRQQPPTTPVRPAETSPATAPPASVMEVPAKEPVREISVKTGISKGSENGSLIEPGLLVSVPLVVFAIRERMVERDGLIFTRKDGHNSGIWKKPLEILRDKDEEGLKNISRTIGKKQILDFLKKEGITVGKELEEEDILLGRGYRVDRTRLIALYDSHVPQEYNGLFPFTARGTGVYRGKEGFELKKVRDEQPVQQVREDESWLMPNLMDQPIKAALEKVIVHSSKIRIYGNGTVAGQTPKPFERVRGEVECVIYGRTYKQ
jgi:hypothetical protein